MRRLPNVWSSRSGFDVSMRVIYISMSGQGFGIGFDLRFRSGSARSGILDIILGAAESEEFRGYVVFREVGDREEWNGLVRGLGGSPLQSWDWGEFRSEQGWRAVRLASEGGESAVQMLLKETPLPGFGSFAYAPYGPVFSEGSTKLKRQSLAAELVDQVRSDGVILLEVEPRLGEGEPVGAGFERSSSSVQPRCTFVMDVLGSEEEQLAAFPKDTRYGVRRAGRQGVVAERSEDIGVDLESFMDLLEETAERQNFALRPREYYRRFMEVLPAHLIVARREGEEQMLAGAIILTFGDESVYLYGASTREGENLYASYLTQFEALSVARREGAKRYDMGGIPCAPVESHPLFGVYRFKKKFGGREERYAGSYEIRLSPLRAGVMKAGISGYYSLQKLRGRGPGPISD